jgi:hypothetical protein
MSFQAKIIGVVGAVMGGALLFILFFRSSEEAAIEAMLREGAEAAQRADAEAVVALVSKEYKHPQGDYAWAVGRVRQALQRSPGQIEILGCAVQVDGEAAQATIKLRFHLGPNERGRIAFDFRLRKEEGAWKVVGSDERWGS